MSLVEGRRFAYPAPEASVEERSTYAGELLAFMQRNKAHLLDFWEKNKDSTWPNVLISVFPEAVAFQGDNTADFTVVHRGVAGDATVAGLLPPPSNKLHGKKAYVVLEQDHHHLQEILRAHKQQLVQTGFKSFGRTMEFRPRGEGNRVGAVGLYVVEQRFLIP